MQSAILETGWAALAAVAGGALGLGLGRLAARRLAVLIAVGLAALLWVTVSDVLPEAKSVLSWPAFLAALGSGVLLFGAISRRTGHICPACSLPGRDGELVLSGDGTRLLLAALTIHCLLDGAAVGVGDGMAGRPDRAMLVGLIVHKAPEGLALALLLLGAGRTRPAALSLTVAVEATTVLGGVLGALSLRGGAAWPSLLFAHVGGGFLYLVASAVGSLLRRPRPAASPAPSEKSLPVA